MSKFTIDQQELDGLKIVKVMKELRRRLEVPFPGLVEMGWIHLYLEHRPDNQWPLVTIESYTDDNAMQASGNGKHSDEIRVRLTVKMSSNDPIDPDSQLRYLLFKTRQALFAQPGPRSEYYRHLLTPTGERLLTSPMGEKQPAQFTLPEPGLPYASVHLSLDLDFVEHYHE